MLSTRSATAPQTAPAFVSLGMVDDRLVGVFLKATLKGLVWFDPRANDLGVPAGWDDLLRTARRFSSERIRRVVRGTRVRRGFGLAGHGLDRGHPPATEWAPHL